MLWRLWMWIVEIERVLRVRYFGLGPLYLYPYYWLKHHLLALMVVSMCPLVAMAVKGKDSSNSIKGNNSNNKGNSNSNKGC